VRPIVARLLTLSQDASALWEQAWRARDVSTRMMAQARVSEVDEAQDRYFDRWEAGSELYDKLSLRDGPA